MLLPMFDEQFTFQLFSNAAKIALVLIIRVQNPPLFI